MTWLIAVALSAPLLVTLHGSAQVATQPTPSGNFQGSIVFSSDRDGDFEIYRVRSDGTDLVQLTHNSAADTSPACSPDGKSIAYVSTVGGVRSVFVMTPGEDARKIAENADESTRIAWSPDGRHIAFDLHSGSKANIHVSTIDGAEQRLLVTDGMWPSWSPDGKTIAFNRGQFPQIHLADVQSRSERSLDLGKTNMPNLFPTWSPDGQSLLYTAVAGVERDATGKQKMTYEIRTVRPDGSHRKSVMKTFGMALGWSPDGQHILLTQGPRNNMDLFTARIDGTDLKALVSEESKESSGCWCGSAVLPDGK